MADKSNDQQVHPLPQNYNFDAAFNVKRDEELASVESDELRRKKRIKYLAYFAAFVVFQTGIIVLFSLTVMKIKTPKFRVRSATFETFDAGTAMNPSFNFRMNAEVGVKNTNFGNYKFQNSTIYFFYEGALIGQAIVPQTKVGWQSTKKMNVVVDLSSSNLPINSQLGNDFNSGVLKLNAQANTESFKKLTANDIGISVDDEGGFLVYLIKFQRLASDFDAIQFSHQ
ncbi:hypothetical protein ACH5RR_034075 [Cinchona calisaya]|uniref:Late embryogenesis abundant protein LEA-2 subgroup domain-containing protein n=1 Tax=Cinchona calisaya TaxID=153742 RepID=A0ABD2YDP2_9GENT